jgi:alpha-ketoglutarate-dependent taurine dioxygenase
VENRNTGASNIKSPAAKRRQAISLSLDDLVKTDYLSPDAQLPLVVEPAVKGLNLVAWAGTNKQFIESSLYKHAGILFRDFGVGTATEFEQFMIAICGELLEYKERSSPRSQVGGRVYTSTDYPAEENIFLHNENSYQQTWPMKIFFYCARAAHKGGETPIADCRKVYERISQQTRQRFIDKGWMYVRNFGDSFGLPWQVVFQTPSKAEVEAHCRANDIEVKWKPGDRLRTRAVRRAAVSHPRTGEMVWFNHATFFHVNTLQEGMRDFLVSEFDQEELPANTFYGDGSPIEESVLEELRAAYRAETVSFKWQEGDVLMLDNMLAAHGRASYEGPRKVLVGMAEPMSWKEL